jgi:hypothetical protein
VRHITLFVSVKQTISIFGNTTRVVDGTGYRHPVAKIGVTQASPYKLTIQIGLEPVPGARGVRYLTVNSSLAKNPEHLRTNGFRARFRTHRCGHARQRVCELIS